jgi:hypothetical protein
MPDGGGHAANLPISSFDQLNRQPTVRDGLAKADRRIPRGDIGLRLQDPSPTWPCPLALDHHPWLEPGQDFDAGHALHLRPVGAPMAMTGVEQALVQAGFVRE